MERVNHINVSQVSCGGFVGKVYRVLERQVPDRKGFKLSITSFNTTFIFVIKLAQTGCHFSTSRAWCCNNNKRTSGFYIIIFSKAFVAVNQRYVRRVAFDCIMIVSLDIHSLELIAESLCRFLSLIVSDYNASNHKTTVLELIAQTENVLVISNSKVTANFVFLNINRANYDDDFCNIGKLHEKL